MDCEGVDRPRHSDPHDCIWTRPRGCQALGAWAASMTGQKALGRIGYLLFNFVSYTHSSFPSFVYMLEFHLPLSLLPLHLILLLFFRKSLDLMDINQLWHVKAPKSLNIYFLLHLFCMCACKCTHIHIHIMVHVWISEGQLEGVGSLLYVGPKDWGQIIRIGGKCL